MLVMLMAGSAMIAAPQAVQQKGASAACEAVPVAIGGSQSAPREKLIDPEARLPSAKPEIRDPAQARPDCTEEPVQRRKRKSDYPMA